MCSSRREEYTLPIDAKQYEELKPKCEYRFLNKVRYNIALDEKHTAELDVYTGALSGLRLVEVEFESEDAVKAFEIPNWFSVEVTYDKRFKNKNLLGLLAWHADY